jgi:hypothetical protein
MGFQVENLLLANRSQLIEKLGLKADDILFDDPYIQTATKRTKGCQVDYLIQTSSQNIYVCEFKFKRRMIGYEVIEDMKTKLARLSIPKGFGVIPVLFHLSEVTSKVYEENFFYKIIDIGDLLE